MRFIKKQVIKPICWNLLQQPWVYDIFMPKRPIKNTKIQ